MLHISFCSKCLTITMLLNHVWSVFNISQPNFSGSFNWKVFSLFVGAANWMRTHLFSRQLIESKRMLKSQYMHLVAHKFFANSYPKRKCRKRAQCKQNGNKNRILNLKMTWKSSNGNLKGKRLIAQANLLVWISHSLDYIPFKQK